MIKLNFHNNFKGFTLVELIVVITILAILGTIGFISLEGYSTQARDAKRISDISSLASKINIEQIRGLDFKELIKETIEEEGQILGTSNQRINTFGKINFENLKETENNFKDPSTKDDYKVAYAVGMGSGGLRYNFFELGTISEKEGLNKIVGNYYTITQEDVPSLFLSGSIEYKNNGEELIYGINNNSSNNEEDNNIFGHFTFDSSTQTITDYSIDGPKDVIIPSHINGVEVKNIGYLAFSDKQLTSVIIPEGIEIIGSRAFYLNQLTEAILPSSVKTIGGRAFRDNLLTNVELNKGLISIGNTAFASNKLTSIEIPDSVISIGSRCFRNAGGLISIKLPSNLERIEEYTFWSNRFIDLEIPPSVTFIGSNAFYGLPSEVNIKASQTICDTYFNRYFCTAF